MPFETYEEALEAAKKIAQERAAEKAQAQGAARITGIEFDVREDFYDLTNEDSRLFIEAAVTAKAVTK